MAVLDLLMSLSAEGSGNREVEGDNVVEGRGDALELEADSAWG